MFFFLPIMCSGRQFRYSDELMRLKTPVELATEPHAIITWTSGLGGRGVVVF